MLQPQTTAVNRTLVGETDNAPRDDAGAGAGRWQRPRAKQLNRLTRPETDNALEPQDVFVGADEPQVTAQRNPISTEADCRAHVCTPPLDF